MNTENYEELKKSLKYLGFGELLNEDLGKAMRAGEKQFTLQTRLSFPLPNSVPEDPRTLDRVAYDLSFKQGRNGITYVNSYLAKLESPLFPERQQIFYIDKGRSFTAKESYNLLSGRSVYKSLENREGERYKAFVQLDFRGELKPNGNYPLKSFHEKFGFQVGEAVAKMPIRFDTLEERDRIIRGLERGNLQKMVLQDGRTVFAQTLPVDKSLRLYDEKLQAVTVHAGRGQAQAPSEKGREARPETAPAAVASPESGVEAKASGGRRKGVKV
ncbi:MAG: hypothetical protein EBZ67_15635 [Chitinophagia bacterium]|nr:hypothetical protein [Chitinophagia bacterium]